jgi:hypothetical protein
VGFAIPIHAQYQIPAAEWIIVIDGDPDVANTASSGNLRNLNPFTSGDLNPITISATAIIARLTLGTGRTKPCDAIKWAGHVRFLSYEIAH